MGTTETTLKECRTEVEKYRKKNDVTETTTENVRRWLRTKGLDEAQVETLLRETGFMPAIPGLKTEGKVEVVRSDVPQLVIPLGLSLDEAIVWIQRQKAFEEQVVELHFEFDTFPLDGARAFMQVLRDTFGWVGADSRTIQTMFGPVKAPPAFIDIEVGPGVHEQVVWGDFKIPGIEGELQTGAAKDRSGMWKFAVTGKIKRKHEGQLRLIAEALREHLKTRSIYRGKALHLTTTAKEGEIDLKNPPTFMHLERAADDELILNRSLAAALQANVMIPIARREALKTHGVPFKRGILFAGLYGTGKTMSAYVAARLCEANGVTFIYLDRAEALPQAITFARMYAPAVVFAEDIDRVAGIERDEMCNSILNTIDGIDSKGQEIMVILTTNHADRINRAMLRPGRLDSVIAFEPPDAETVERLIRFYGRTSLEKNIDTHYAGMKLAGRIPAVIRETVERAKLFAIAGGAGANGHSLVTTEALGYAVDNMLGQVQLLESLDAGPTVTEAERLATALRNVVANGSHERIEATGKKVDDLHKHVVG